MSCIPPDPYRERFIDYMNGIFQTENDLPKELSRDN